jgi:hypothetical protein
MDVFLVPVGRDRHELYCEVPIEQVAGPSMPGPQSWWRRQVDRFRQLLAEAEEERRQHERGQPTASGGVWRWILRKVAEAIAEQRLLWLLRRLNRATLLHPDDVPPARALEIARQSFHADFERHRRWLVIDSVVLLVCLPLTVIPGPNVPSLYFSFRAVGHYLSMRGARKGRSDIEWQLVASGDLTSLRHALSLDGAARRARIEQIAAALGLDRLDVFVERIA